MIILETERLLFRPHELGDFEAYCAMEQDPEFRRYVGGAPRTREAAEAKFREILRPVRNHLGMWATVLKENGCYVGRCGIYQHIQTDAVISGEGVLAFYLARFYWGRGLASEAGSAFVKFGFEELALKKIVATVQEGNRASERVLEKLNFNLVWKEEGPRTFCHFALLPPENHL
ncbi:MAG TPA: GNAT family N-acetyltransferase [Silvibacterium sp.]|nr:GNAT family N-acetyltransferase [Silvibacterium sp.]